MLDVHRDSEVYPSSPGMTRERVVAELEFYGVQDFDGVPMDRSVESTLRTHQEWSSEFSKWQQEQKSFGYKLLKDGFAKLFLATATIMPEEPEILKIGDIDVDKLRLVSQGKVSPDTETNGHIIKFFEDWGTKVTVDPLARYNDPSNRHYIIKLKPVEPVEGA